MNLNKSRVNRKEYFINIHSETNDKHSINLQSKLLLKISINFKTVGKPRM